MSRRLSRLLGRGATGAAIAADPGPAAQDLLDRAQRTRLVLHIGLHKTASSYVQGVLAAHRDELLAEGVLYPTTGLVDKAGTGTREGAGSGQALFSRRAAQPELHDRLLAELPDGVDTVLISSEEFTRPGPTPTPEQVLDRFAAFGTAEVVLVLRRQDDWIESFYKQAVDQFRNYETRSFEQYLRQTGLDLLDFRGRFAPWREAVGPEHFHVLSYDDLPDAAAACRRLLEISGVRGQVLERLDSVPVPRYDSVRAIDTLGLRILNSHRLGDRATRTRIARSIYDVGPAGDIELLSPEVREEIRTMCDPGNARIEAEWFTEPVPGFRFGSPPRSREVDPPTGLEMVQYVDRVLSLCADDRPRRTAKGRGGERA